MAVMQMVKREPLPRKDLQVSDTKVAQALDHIWALQKLFKEMHEQELERARKTPNLVVRLKPANGPRASYEKQDSVLDELMR